MDEEHQRAPLMTQVNFLPADIPELSHAVSMFPNLEFACVATITAKKLLKFPILNHEGMFPLLKASNLPSKILNRKITEAHLRKFFPKEFFPITDSRDLLGKVLAALSWGDIIHGHEKFLVNPANYSPIPYKKVN